MPLRRLKGPSHAGQMIRHRRRRLGMLQCELGQRVGVSTTTVSLWENGREVVSFKRREMLAEILGIDPNRLADPETFLVTSKDRRILDGDYGLPPSERAAMDELLGLRTVTAEACPC